MRRPIFYPFLCTLARWTTRVYFRRIEVEGLERLPARGPVILAANHPQSITDAVVLAVATPRLVHYVAHGGLFANPFTRFLMEGGGAIPIHRPRDVQGASGRNRQSFASCVKVLARGGCIGIFPEGISEDEPRLQRLKTGTVRIALQAEEEHDFGLGVSIVPVGLGFQSALSFRSRVLVTFGDPLIVREARSDFASDPESTVRRLTDDLTVRLRHQVVHVEREELEDFVRDVESVYRGELLEREGLEIEGHSRFAREQTVNREIARAAEEFYEHRPEVIADIRALLDGYHRHLEKLRLPDAIVRDEKHGFRAEAIRFAVVLVIGLPIAAWGTIWNWIPYRLTGIVARHLASDRTKIHWWQLASGSVLFLVFYAAWLLFAMERFDTAGTIAFMASLPPAGLFAQWYGTALGRRRAHVRWAALRGSRAVLVRRTLELRRVIIEAMDAALAEHLHRSTRHEPKPATKPRTQEVD